MKLNSKQKREKKVNKWDTDYPWNLTKKFKNSQDIKRLGMMINIHTY